MIAAAAEVGLRERGASYAVELDRRAAIRAAVGEARRGRRRGHRGKGARVGPGRRGHRHPVRRPGGGPPRAGVTRVDLTRDEIAHDHGRTRRRAGHGRVWVRVRLADPRARHRLRRAARRARRSCVRRRRVRAGRDRRGGGAGARRSGWAARRGGRLERGTAGARRRGASNRLDGAAVIGITGSAGKTSTKDLTAAALAPNFVVHASVASFNNEIGLPVTLLDAPIDAGAVVLEMGARFAGNITELCEIARPSIGVITHIGLAHAEHLGGADGIAAVKGELVDALPADGSRRARTPTAGTSKLCVGERGTGGHRRRGCPGPTCAPPRSGSTRTSGRRSGWTRRGGASPTSDSRSAACTRSANAAQAAAVALHLGVPLASVVAALATATSASWRMELDHVRRRCPRAQRRLQREPELDAGRARHLRAAARPRPADRRARARCESWVRSPRPSTRGRRDGRDAGVAVLVTVGPGTDELAAAARAGGVEVVERRGWRRGGVRRCAQWSNRVTPSS